MTTPGNELLAELDVYPDHGTVVVEDGGHSDPETQIVINGRHWGYPGSVRANQHSIHVVTMSADTADRIGRDVRVRVYRGQNESDLGTLLFDGILNLAETTLAIGELLVEPETLQRVDVGHAGPTRIQIYAQNSVPLLKDEPDIPTDLNILVEPRAVRPSGTTS
jgi:hypothetical protein